MWWSAMGGGGLDNLLYSADTYFRWDESGGEGLWWPGLNCMQVRACATAWLRC